MGFGLLHSPLPVRLIKEYFYLNIHRRNQKQSLFQQDGIWLIALTIIALTIACQIDQGIVLSQYPSAISIGVSRNIARFNKETDFVSGLCFIVWLKVRNVICHDGWDGLLLLLVWPQL